MFRKKWCPEQSPFSNERGRKNPQSQTRKLPEILSFHSSPFSFATLLHRINAFKEFSATRFSSKPTILRLKKFQKVLVENVLKRYGSQSSRTSISPFETSSKFWNKSTQRTITEITVTNSALYTISFHFFSSLLLQKACAKKQLCLIIYFYCNAKSTQKCLLPKQAHSSQYL